MVRRMKLHWWWLVLGAVVGAASMILASETIRWWVGKGFFK